MRSLEWPSIVFLHIALYSLNIATALGNGHQHLLHSLNRRMFSETDAWNNRKTDQSGVLLKIPPRRPGEDEALWRPRRPVELGSLKLEQKDPSTSRTLQIYSFKKASSRDKSREKRPFEAPEKGHTRATENGAVGNSANAQMNRQNAEYGRL